jgi:hypothetical protein
MKCIILLLMCSGALWAQSPQAVIRELTGTVELKSGETGDWIPARPDDILTASAIISTGFRSTAILAVGNSTLTVRPVTRLSLEELISQNAVETISVGLRTGRIRAEVTPPAGGTTNFTIRTPNATASVRGTAFEIDASNIRVIEGAVRYAGAGRPVLVGAGQNSRIDGDTGGAQNPVLAADTDRALPALPGPGQVLAPPVVETVPASGTLAVEVTLES